jgi:hypothetical protein
MGDGKNGGEEAVKGTPKALTPLQSAERKTTNPADEGPVRYVRPGRSISSRILWFGTATPGYTRLKYQARRVGRGARWD